MGCNESKLLKIFREESGGTELTIATPSAQTTPAGLLGLPWDIVEQILLQETLTFRDVVSTLRVLAPPHQTAREYISEVTGSERLWLTKFRSLYPHPYRVLLESETCDQGFDWYDMLKTRCEIRETSPRLRDRREKDMENLPLSIALFLLSQSAKGTW